MPRGGDQSDYVKEKQRRLKHFMLHFPERKSRIRVQVGPQEAHGRHMPRDVSEGNAAGPALCRVHPVASPGIGNRVSISAEPDVEAVERMVGDGKPDAEELKEEHQRKIRQKADLTRISSRAADRGRVRDQDVFEQKRTNWNDSSQRMQPPQKK